MKTMIHKHTNCVYKLISNMPDMNGYFSALLIDILPKAEYKVSRKQINTIHSIHKGHFKYFTFN